MKPVTFAFFSTLYNLITFWSFLLIMLNHLLALLFTFDHILGYFGLFSASKPMRTKQKHERHLQNIDERGTVFGSPCARGRGTLVNAKADRH